MRSLFAILFLLAVASCNKNKPVAKYVGGDWVMVRLVKDDGSEYTKKINYTFDKASADGSTFTNWQAYNVIDSVSMKGNYCVIGKGLYIVINQELESGVFTDTAKVEDIGKKSMVIRTKQGLNYFEKVKP